MYKPRSFFTPLAGLVLSLVAFAAITLDNTLPQASLGQPYNFTLAPSGGSGPYTYAITTGSLPVGLSISPTGVITGTPQSAGSYTFTLQTTDATNATLSTPFTFRVGSSSGLNITNNTLAQGLINTPYILNLGANGGSSPYSWDLVLGGGMLPPGIILTSQGTLQGTPTSGGVYPVTIRVTDVNGNSYQSALTLRIEATTLAIATNSLATASTNVPYSQGLSAIGGTPPYTFSIQSGTLPAGLTLSSGGVISGSPTSAGTSNFVVRVTDSAQRTASANLNIETSGTGPRIVITSLPVGRLNQSFNASLNTQGGTPPYTYSLQSGTLPAGLTLNLNGTITGTPTASGVFPITIRVGDAGSQSSQAELLLNVNSSAFNITTSTAPNATVGTAYSLPLTSSGGTAPVSYTVLSGTLPAGLSLSTTGTLSGTPTTAGTSNFVIRATDASGATAQVPLTIATQSSSLNFSPSGLANAQVGQLYTSSLAASGGAPPYSYNIVTGTLPPGLTLSSNGNISGTPTSSGLYQVTYRVIDANQRSLERTFPLYVTGTGVRPVTLTLPAGQPTQAYNATLQATGGTGPYTYQVSSGTLPTGLTLTPAGVLSGTLTQTTNGSFTVRITDAAGATSFVTYPFNANASGINLTSTVPSTGAVGQLYSTNLTTSGGAAGNTTYSITSGALPPGLTLSSGGTLSGTPTTPGTYVFNIRATGSDQATANFTQAITIGSAQLGFATTNVPIIGTNTPFTFALNGVNGTGPYTFTVVSGNLPGGITLSSAGSLSGTSSAAGNYPVTVRITDATGASATSVLNLTVGMPSTFSISTTALPSGRTGQSYLGTIVASGGTAPYTFQLAPGSSLPGGLTLSSSGEITGTPTADTTSSFTVRATDAAGGTAQATLNLNIGSTGLSLTTPQFANGIVGRAYSSFLYPVGGASPYTFALVSGNLPPGLTLNSSGTLSGTPTTAGNYPVVIRVSDTAGVSIQQNFNIMVNSSSLSFVNAQLPGSYVGQNYRANLQAASGTGPFTFTIASGSLPAGLTLTPDGLISGTPTTAGQSTVTFRVTDANGATATNTLTIGAQQSTVNFGFTSIPNGAVGQPFRFTPTGSGTGSFSTFVLGGLPPGLVATENGDIAGVPTREGTYYVTLRTQNASGASVVSSFPLIIAAGTGGGSGFRITNATLPNATTNAAYNQTLSTTGGSGTSTFAVSSGSLPPGLTLTSAGVLSGTVTTAGNYSFTIRATDAANATTTTNYTFTVSEPGIRFTTATLPSGTLNTAYNQTLAFSGGTAPYTVTVTQGTLPTGLSISPAGVISGTPTAAGNSPFTLRVTDSTGATSTNTYLIGIGAVGAPALTSLVSAANYQANAVVPGEIVVIYGTNIGPANLVSATVTNNTYGTTLSGTRVLFDDTPAPVLYASANQIAVVAPFNLTGKTTTRIVVESMGVQAAAIQLPVVASRPAIFTANASGTGAGAILNQDSSVNTAQNPAEKQSIISLYVTGLGQTNPASEDGRIIAGQSTLVTPVTATINGQTAEVLYGGGAPGLVPGLAQINLRLPANTVTGANTIQLTSGGRTTSGNVTVFVR